VRAARRVPECQPQVFAAVDLGSNSFHLVVARQRRGELEIIDRLQEMVRLAGGLDARQQLTPEAMATALACLSRFGQRLRGVCAGSVRAIGTSTLRRARNRAEFLVGAEQALGARIEIVSGREEARLIHLGVSHAIPGNGPHLVIDIGGGSTELIVGEGHEPRRMESLHLGCVGMSRRHFGDGRITARRMEAAVTAARLELEPVEAQFRAKGRQVYGSSGTIRVIGTVVREAGWSSDAITSEALARLQAAVLEAGNVRRLRLSGLNEERAPVFAGGVAILLAVFAALGIETMRVSESALREGLLYDLVGRVRHTDIRGRSVTALCTRYAVDGAQAARVESTARAIFGQVSNSWGLDEEDAAQLAWAARLHEAGLAISHSQYHKHGEYLVRNADLLGFSTTEQQLLAALVRAHRRKFPEAEFEALPKSDAAKARHLALILRLAALLHRSRTPAALPQIEVTAAEKGLNLSFPRGWLAAHPLTAADLAQEREYLARAGLGIRSGHTRGAETRS
jgi:exopolyphosphatase/guanosine-5'-triphosphate,3'-diphosphate pyrophosphatase